MDVGLLLVGGSTNQFHHYLDIAHPFLPCFLGMCVFEIREYRKDLVVLVHPSTGVSDQAHVCA